MLAQQESYPLSHLLSPHYTFNLLILTQCLSQNNNDVIIWSLVSLTIVITTFFLLSDGVEVTSSQ